MTALSIAVHGLGYTAALIAMQGLLKYVGEEVKKHEAQAGGGLKTRRRIATSPAWVPEIKTDDEEALLVIFGVI